MNKDKRLTMYILTAAITISTMISGCSLLKDKNKTPNTIEMFSTRAIVTQEDTTSTKKKSSKKSKDTNVEYEKGKLTDTTYESEFINVKFTLPQNYIMANSNDLDDQMEAIYDQMGLGDYIISSAASRTSLEMSVFNKNGFPAMNVMVEKILRNMDEETYMEVLKSNFNSANGVYFILGNTTSSKIAGKKYQCLPMTISVGNYQVHEDFYIRKQDDRIIAFIIAYTSDTASQADTLLNAFTKLR